MYHFDSVDGWEWLWMTVMLGFWVVVLGLVIYIAVKIAKGDRGTREHHDCEAAGARTEDVVRLS